MNCPRCGTELSESIRHDGTGAYRHIETLTREPHTPDRCADVLAARCAEYKQQWEEAERENDALTRRVAELEGAANAVADYVLDQATFPLRYEGTFRNVIANLSTLLAATQAPRKEGGT